MIDRWTLVQSNPLDGVSAEVWIVCSDSAVSNVIVLSARRKRNDQVIDIMQQAFKAGIAVNFSKGGEAKRRRRLRDCAMVEDFSSQLLPNICSKPIFDMREFDSLTTMVIVDQAR